VADLRKTQPEWTRFLGREVAGMFLAAIYELQAMEERYSRQRTPVLVLNDVQGNHVPGGVKLEGVDLGVNTSQEGFAFVRVTGAADPRTVSVYRAPGGAAQDLVARGQGDAGTVLALAEQNRSGLSGAWELPANVTEDTTDLLRVFPVPDWPVRLKRVWDGTVEKDVRSQDEFLAAMESVAAQLRDARLIMLEAFTAFAIRLGNRGADFLRATSTSLVTDSPLRDGSGSVSRRRVGFLADLSRAMKAESVAGEQSIARRVVKAQAAVFAPGNRGKGKVGAHAPREFCPPARWTFKCSRGQDTGYGGGEEFECTVKVLDEDRQFTFGGVRIKQSFSGPDGIGPFVLERIYTKDGDPNHRNFLQDTQVTTSGERSGNTEAGILHWEVRDRGAGFEISFYRSASRGQGDLVARAEGVSIRTPFQATERNASGLTVNWASGVQPQDGATGTLDCNFFRVENQAGVPDEFVIETAVVSEGQIQKLLAEQLGGHLNSKPPGQETIPDDFLKAGNPISLLESA